jgi:hypothetical protein
VLHQIAFSHLDCFPPLNFGNFKRGASIVVTTTKCGCNSIVPIH